jgi:hypothetical protein
MSESEDALAKSVAKLLQRTLDPRVVWWHTPNGGVRSLAEAAKFKAMGVRAGVADLIFFWPGSIIFGGSKLQVQMSLAIELKTSTGRQSAAQEQFQEDWQATGGRYVIARSLGGVINILRIHGVPFKNEVRV